MLLKRFAFRAGLVPTLIALAVSVVRAQNTPSPDTAPTTHVQNLVLSTVGTPTPLNINNFLGASTFYSNGYNGSNAVAANIEGGYFWNRHEILSYNTLLLPTGGAGTQLGEFDSHATAVSGLIAGRTSASNGGTDLQRGIAYGAGFWSGAIATDWVSSGEYNVSAPSFITPYVAAMQTGINGRYADAINGSYTYSDSVTGVSGADSMTVSLDGLANTTRRTLVFAAGNAGVGNNRVGAPAGGYNSISVGALQYGSDSNPYSTLAGYSSGGPSDYRAPDGTVVSNIRARVDILAPGQDMYLASYNGKTGGGKYDGTSDNPPTDEYRGGAGTSFASPIVAGGATLLCDVGHARFGGGEAIDNTVIKAVLLNSADKLDGWNNGQTTTNGVVTTTQALDYSQGAGRMNLDKAFTQYTAGATNLDVPASGTIRGVSALGWDFGSVLKNTSTDYYFATSLVGGSTFTGTLNWTVDRIYNGLVADNANPGPNDYSLSASDNAFVKLNLELWSVNDGAPMEMVGISEAQYINTQHFSFALPQTGNYMLRVNWAGTNYDTVNTAFQNYGLAWSGTAITGAEVPEPSAALLMCFGGTPFAILFLRRQVRAR